MRQTCKRTFCDFPIFYFFCYSDCCGFCDFLSVINHIFHKATSFLGHTYKKAQQQEQQNHTKYRSAPLLKRTAKHSERHSDGDSASDSASDSFVTNFEKALTNNYSNNGEVILKELYEKIQQKI